MVLLSKMAIPVTIFLVGTSTAVSSCTMTHYYSYIQPTFDDDDTESFQSGSPGRKVWLESNKIWQIAAPSIFCPLAMFSLTVIAQSFVGHLGNTNLAAISIATTVIISIAFGFLGNSFVDPKMKHGVFVFVV